MLLIDNRDSNNPYINLAIEEFVMRNSITGNADSVLLYINEPCVVVGKNQSIYQEVNFDVLRTNTVKLCRRISGGGTVYHDFGNISFAFFSPFHESKVNNYKWFNRPILDALCHAGIEAGMDSRNNIIYQDKKISGNAQFTDRKTILSHGTLLFDTDLPTLKRCLGLNSFSIETKAVRSVRSEVVNLSSFIPSFSHGGAFMNYLKEELKCTEVYRFSDSEWSRIEILASEKFESHNWIYGRSPKTTIIKDGLKLVVEDGKITALEPEVHLAQLIGVNYNYKDLNQALNSYLPAERDILLHRLF